MRRQDFMRIPVHTMADFSDGKRGDLPEMRMISLAASAAQKQGPKSG